MRLTATLLNRSCKAYAAAVNPHRDNSSLASGMSCLDGPFASTRHIILPRAADTCLTTTAIHAVDDALMSLQLHNWACQPVDVPEVQLPCTCTHTHCIVRNASVTTMQPVERERSDMYFIGTAE